MKFEILNIKGDTADVHLYKPMLQTPGVESISQTIAGLVGKVKRVRLFVNSPGGSVVEGIALFNVLQRFDAVEIYIDGIAASMAAIITQVPNAKVYMARFAKLMLHGIKSTAQGSAEDLITIAGMMNDFKGDLINIITNRTGLTPEAVSLQYFDGQDHWLNAEQALAAKLIDGIVDGKLKVQPPKQDDTALLYSFYENQIFNHSPNINQMLKLISLLNMKQDATEEQIEAQISAVLLQNSDLTSQITAKDATIAQLQTSVDTFNQARIDELIANALTAGKITAEMKPTYEKLAKVNFDDCKAILNSIAPYQPISGQLNPNGTPVADARKDWTFKKWQQEDGPGLLNLKANYYDYYKNLYITEFGKEPKN